MSEKKNAPDEAAKPKDRSILEDSTYESLDKEFVAVLHELSGDQSLEKFRHEYEKLYEALKKSNDNERKLMAKCHELNAEIQTNANKIQAALKMSQDDQTLIESLKQDVEKAWSLVEAAHEKEVLARETTTNLKKEVANLTKLVEQGTAITGQEEGIAELLRVNEELTTDLESKVTEVTHLMTQLSEQQEKQTHLETKHQEAQDQIVKLENQIQQRENDSQREQRRKEKLERDMKDARAEAEHRMAELKNLKQQIEKYQADVLRLEAQQKDAKAAVEKQLRDAADVMDRYKKLQTDFNNQELVVNTLMAENQSRNAELKMKEDEVTSLKIETQRLSKMRDGVLRKLRATEEQKTAVEHQREMLKTQMGNLEKGIDTLMKQSQVDRKAAEDLLKERDATHKELIKANEDTMMNADLVRIHKQAIDKLRKEINDFRVEAIKQRKLIFHLERMRNDQIEQASKLTAKVLHLNEEMKVFELQILEYKKKEVEAESRLKEQQNIYEAVRNDRNVFSKHLIETKDEMAELKKRMGMIHHQIDQLKEEVSYKEACIIKEHLENQRLEKDKEALKIEIQRQKKQLSELQAHIEDQEAQQRQLRRIAARAEAAVEQLKKDLDRVVCERDILGTQLVRRNDELSLLYEKIKIQQVTLNKGEMQYNQRLEDIRILKKEIRNLRCKRTQLEKGLSSLEDMRRDLYRQQRELLLVRTRCKALEEELENPMNVHRWRKLEGSDPSLYEMIQKMQTIQRRLIFKTEEVVEKELIIKEKEQLYIELKRILARQPGLEAAEQMAMARKIIRRKTQQMKAMMSELNMHETQVSEYKWDIERLVDELRKVKEKYFRVKGREHLNKDLTKNRPMKIQPNPSSNRPQYIGGGFLVNQGRAT